MSDSALKRLGGLRLTDSVIICYLVVTSALALHFRESLLNWGTYVVLHLVGAALIYALAYLHRVPRPLAFLRDWYPVILFPVLYKEVEVFARAFGDWRLTETVRQWELALFSGLPSDFLSVDMPWLPLSEYLHFCYLSYLFLIPAVGGYWYFTKRRSAFRELMLAVSLTFSISYLFYIFFPVDSPFYISEQLSEPLSEGFLYKLVHFFSSRGGARGGAFPSTHVSMSTIVWLIAWKRDRRLGWLLLLNVPGIFLATVYGRFHYALDVFAGWGLAVGLYLLVQQLTCREEDESRELGMLPAGE